VTRPLARLPKGLNDYIGTGLSLHDHLIAKLSEVYRRYGFEKLVTPSVEYADALGSYLSDHDSASTPFLFKDDDAQPLILRYDLTAPLARYVAQNFAGLSLPFRRFQTGSVFRNDKVEPGRFREFTQFDADTVGSASVAADAEFCMLISDSLSSLGLKTGDYIVRLNNRKIINGLLDLIGAGAGAIGTARYLGVIRSMDKVGRLGLEGVKHLLGAGRMDKSGDFAEGAGLNANQIDRILEFLSFSVNVPVMERAQTCKALEKIVIGSATGEEGVRELMQIDAILAAANFGSDRVRVDPSVARGLSYYTGPVFEAELTFEDPEAAGKPQSFGSVGGGGRYDDLVESFLGFGVPATGVSLGVSRLAAALELRNLLSKKIERGPIVVLVLDRDMLTGYQAMVSELRNAGVPAEMYLGDKDMRSQIKYADKRRSPYVVIEGSREREKGVVAIKDLSLGKQISGEIGSYEEWLKSPAQISVQRSDLVKEIMDLLDPNAPKMSAAQSHML